MSIQLQLPFAEFESTTEIASDETSGYLAPPSEQPAPARRHPSQWLSLASRAIFRRSHRAMLKDGLMIAIASSSLLAQLPLPVIRHVAAPSPAVPSNQVMPREEEEIEFSLPSLDFLMPVAGVSLSSLSASRLPNAPRAYRRGLHPGFDVYCPFGTSVRAIASGMVIRADEHFSELDPKLHRFLQAQCAVLNATPSDILDRLRGRAIVIDHGVVQGARVRSVYAHLSAVEVRAGMMVERGEVIGQVGNSGTEAGVRGSRDEAHLHLEIWFQRSGGREFYLGQGLSELSVRQFLAEVFDDQ